MVVKINAPAQRSLNANEKIVYDMLRKGLKPKEIADITGIPLNPVKNYNQADHWSAYDVDVVSIKDIICNIRAKGYEIEEEDEMRGYPIPEEVKSKIIELYEQGMPTPQIVAQTGLSRTSVKRIIASAHYMPDMPAEKMPATVETVTGKKQSDTNIIADIRTNCKPQIIKEILDRELTERAEELAKKQREIDRITEYLICIKEQYDYMMAEYEMISEVM